MVFSTLNESNLHNSLKILYQEIYEGKIEVEQDGHVYDIVTKNGNVIEIQTKNLAKLLPKILDTIEKGHNVYVLNRGNDEQSVGALHIKADRHLLGDPLKKYRFDAVLDVTAYNAQDVKGLVDGLGEYGTYVLVSSSAVYPETLSQPFRENDLT